MIRMQNEANPSLEAWLHGYFDTRGVDLIVGGRITNEIQASINFCNFSLFNKSHLSPLSEIQYSEAHSLGAIILPPVNTRATNRETNQLIRTLGIALVIS
jgi:hypothetical protein